jgi:hypothetical protein
VREATRAQRKIEGRRSFAGLLGKNTHFRGGFFFLALQNYLVADMSHAFPTSSRGGCG